MQTGRERAQGCAVILRTCFQEVRKMTNRGKKVGWIGLGKMGLPMATRLIRAGYEVAVYNRTRARVDALQGQGAVAAESPKALGESCDLVFTMISDDAALEEVALSRNGVLENAAAGRVLVDMSTVSPKTSLQVARRAAEKEVLYLRAPVSGSTKFAEAGTLTIFVSGPERAFEECRAVLQVLGQKFFYLGAGEEARSLKLLVNMMVGTTAMMVAEALNFGRKSGIDWATMIEAINQSVVASPLIAYKAQALKERNFAPVFAAEQMAKDFDLALETGKALNLPLPVTALVRQFYAGMQATGKGNLDFFAMVTFLEEWAGIRKE